MASTPSGPAATETVYGDPRTELYHRDADAEIAGEDPIAFSLMQAKRFGFQPCPTCYTNGGHDE